MLEVDCLVGSDDWLWSFQEGEIIRGGPKEPVAVKTSLAWFLSGPLKGKTLDSNNFCNLNVCVDPTISCKLVEPPLKKNTFLAPLPPIQC